jgi:hypothetical protein
LLQFQSSPLQRRPVPFSMIWPPTFPALKYDPARFVFWPLDYLYTTLVEVT